jgi:cobalt-precorrin-5B (C1)-methyltransferase
MVKLAQGHMDLHSGRSQVDFQWLAGRVMPEQRNAVLKANTALEVLELAGPELAQAIATKALASVYSVLGGSEISCDVMVIDRAGKIIGHAR